jgi:hypothetical protein
LCKLFENNTDIKNNVLQIISRTDIDKGSKINKIYTILKGVSLPTDETIDNTLPTNAVIKGTEATNDNVNEILLKTIINQIYNDNKENLIINNIITSENYKDDIIIRDTESVLLNIDDILNWIKKYKQTF